jgi:hypothetical protein
MNVLIMLGGLGAAALITCLRNRLNVRWWHIPEVAPAASEGRLRFQSGLW